MQPSIPTIQVQASNDELQRVSSESSLESAASTPKAVHRKPTDELTKVDMAPELIEEELMQCILEGNAERFHQLTVKCKTSQLLQTILTYSHNNTPPKETDSLGLSLSAASKSSFNKLPDSQDILISPKEKQSRRLSTAIKQPGRQSSMQYATQLVAHHHFVQFDPDLQEVALELLGSSLSPLSMLHISLVIGEEALSHELLQFVFQQTTRKGQKLPLMEFLNRAWGDGNCALHLASFHGMSDIVDQLLKSGANPHKRNEKGYKPVDCADDDQTRRLFRIAIEMMRLSGNETALKRQGSIMTRTGGHPKIEKQQSTPAVVQNPITAPVVQAQHKLSLQDQQSSSGSVDKIKEESQQLQRSQSAPIKPDPVILQKSVEPTLPTISSNSRLASGKAMQKSSLKSEAGPPSLGKKKVINWNQNALLLDYSKNGETENVRQLIAEHKVSLMTLGEDSPTLASQEQDKLLFINSSNGQGLTALHFACAYGHQDICDILLANGANLNAKDREGFTPLHALVAEIPLKLKVKVNDAKAQAQVSKRTRYLQFLEKWLQIPEVQVQALTDDGDSVLDLIRDDDDGMFDQEVYDVVVNAARARNVNLEALSSPVDETESMSRSFGQSINVSQHSIPDGKSATTIGADNIVKVQLDAHSIGQQGSQKHTTTNTDASNTNGRVVINDTNKDVLVEPKQQSVQTEVIVSKANFVPKQAEEQQKAQPIQTSKPTIRHVKEQPVEALPSSAPSPIFVAQRQIANDQGVPREAPEEEQILLPSQLRAQALKSSQSVQPPALIGKGPGRFTSKLSFGSASTPLKK